MRNYWLKIAAGALGIFAVGMVVINTAKVTTNRVKAHLNSSDPIPLPLIGLVPFRLDDQRLGALDRIDLLRNEPERISGVRVIVKLADSVDAARLNGCQLLIDDVKNLNEHSSFRCEPTGSDPTGFEPFGTVVMKGRGDSLTLLLPARTATELRTTRFTLKHGEINVESDSDSLQEALDAMADSLEAMGDSISEAMSDSVARTYRGRADSLRRAIQAQAEAIRVRAHEARIQARAAGGTAEVSAPAAPQPIEKPHKR